MTTREAKNDFAALENFIRCYDIAPSLAIPSFVAHLKVIHRRLFGLLTFIAEIENANPDIGIYTEESLKYFAECASDVSQSLFSWMHGAYKPAYLSLRGSIETFLKAAVGTELPSLFTEKSMYRLLDLAKESTPCGGLAAPHFAKLKECYADLCAIAHSAKAAKFSQVNALRMFPKFEEKDASDFVDKFITVIDRMLAIMLAAHRDVLRKMHYKNRINTLDALTNDIKRSILSEEAQ